MAFGEPLPMVDHVRPGGRPQPPGGLVFAFRVHADGAAEELSVDQPLDDRPDGWLWLHFNLADTRACTFLKSLRELPADAIEILVAPDRHQQLHAEDNCVYGVIADLRRALEGVSDHIGLLHFAMTERFLISGRRHPLNATQAARDMLRGGFRPLSVAALLELIVEHVIDANEHLAGDIAGQLDRIEERVVEAGTSEERRSLGMFRRTTVHLHRHLAGLRTLFQRLERNTPSSLPANLRLEAGYLSQQLDALDHEIVALRERARVLQEEVTSQLAEETNRQLRVLTTVTILFLPPTVVAGFFGMNLKGLPFAEGEAGFWGGVLVSVAAAAAVYALLRWLGIVRR
jgi:zinc transporter